MDESWRRGSQNFNACQHAQPFGPSVPQSSAALLPSPQSQLPTSTSTMAADSDLTAPYDDCAAARIGSPAVSASEPSYSYPPPSSASGKDKYSDPFNRPSRILSPRRSRSPVDRRADSRSPSAESSSRRSRRRSSHSRSRSPDRRRRRRSRSRSRSRSLSPEWRFDSRRRTSSVPHHTVIARNLPLHTDESLLWTLICAQGFHPRDIRLMRKRDTGQSRGFGFVEFADVETATRWIDTNQGQLALGGDASAELQYSMNRPGHFGAPPVVGDAPQPGQRFGDWICSKCSTNNFKKREQCFKCGIWRKESEELGDCGFTEIGLVPCDTLLLRDLPTGCTEAKILTGLKRLSTLTPVQLAIAPSKAFAYVQMRSMTEAAQLHTTLTSMTRLKMGGQEILVSYSKLPLGDILSGGTQPETAADWRLQAARIQRHLDGHRSAIASAVAKSKQHCQTDAANAAAAVAQSAMRKAQAMRVVTSHVMAEQLQAATLASALVPGSALILGQEHQLLAAKALQDAAVAQLTAAARTTVHTPFGELPRYPIPDTSTYQYESKSGYYFDPATGLYYDAESRYYYNGDSQQWLYWDANYQTYLPTQHDASNKEADQSATADPESSAESAVPQKPNAKTEKVKTAKRIQDDMDKWAKRQNKAKVMVDSAFGAPNVPQPPAAAEPQPAPRPSAAADMAFSVLEKTKAGLVEYDGVDSDEERRSTAAQNAVAADVNLDDWTDWQRLACLLCRRQFPTKEVLVKHQQFSDLHKKNIEEKRLELVEAAAAELAAAATPSSSSASSSAVYRDRAKERRQKYGAVASEAQPNALKDKYMESISESLEQPTAQGIGADNVGNRLLKSMGWTEGRGLGKQSQGIVDPIEQHRRIAGAGLGAAGAVVKTKVGANYKESVRQALRDRFHELE